MTRFDPEMLNNPRALRNAFGTFMTGVTVVTAFDAKGAPLGFTANSFASVSLEPPLVMVCLANSSANYDSFANAEAFAVNVLSEDQIDVSNTFARPVDDRFGAVEWQPGPHGAPILGNVSAWFDCATHKTVDAGDHLVLIGEVKAYDQSAAPGLGYVRGAYVTPAAEAAALNARAGVVVSALIENDGNVLLVDCGDGHLGLPATRVTEGSVTQALRQLIQDVGVSAQPGFVYSIYEDKAQGVQHLSFLCQADDSASAKGAFTEVSFSTLTDVADPAMCAILERYARESQNGLFGVYYGNEVSGDVQQLPGGRKAP